MSRIESFENGYKLCNNELKLIICKLETRQPVVEHYADELHRLRCEAGEDEPNKTPRHKSFHGEFQVGGVPAECFAEADPTKMVLAGDFTMENGELHLNCSTAINVKPRKKEEEPDVPTTQSSV